MTIHSETSNPQALFMQAFRGSFTSALRWHHLDELWERLRQRADHGWYIYAIGETPPEHPSDAQQVRTFINEVDHLLRTEHNEDYCGIVYADNLQEPTFVKIYDPNNLGVSCGYSDNPPLPRWIMTKIPPCLLDPDQVVPKNRRRWWRRLLSRK